MRRISRDWIRADIVEGYDAYWDGILRKDCPYPDIEECKELREMWFRGWDEGDKEVQDSCNEIMNRPLP